MRQLYKKATLLLLLLLSLSLQSKSQVMANDDVAQTGPFQKVRVKVTKNDNITCTDYSLSVVSVTPYSSGIAAFDNSILVFTPSIAPATSQTVTVRYKVLCKDGTSSEANVAITIQPYNLPLNIIQTDDNCIGEMPSVSFGIKTKFKTEDGMPANGYRIDGFTSPLVGDLNGDGKPEIVALGVLGGDGGVARNDARYINIYNGQSGARIYRYDLGTSYPQSYATGYHRAPSALAIADVDNDGIGEIVYTMPDGKIAALKPIFIGTTITGMTQMWEGKANGSNVSYRAPVTALGQFTVASPYIVDINGDGIPEVVVYNKVFNGATGALLMSWQGAAAAPKASNVTATTGLANQVSDLPTAQANATAARNVAMTGRRPGVGALSDQFVAVPAIGDIDGDGIQEIATGNRIYKIKINSLIDHTQNTYTTIEGPEYVDLKENTNNTTTKRHYLTDGFTRLADIDGDGHLDVIVATFANHGELDVKILVYVWDPRFPNEVKAALTYFSDGVHGNFGIPFVGDINGRNDGWGGSSYTLKLPEICIIAGGAYINRTNAGVYNNTGRTGIKFHPQADEKLRQGTADNTSTTAGWDNNQLLNPNRRFNKVVGYFSEGGHIIGLTYDAQATDIEDRLKLSWAMEHADRSQNTGITLFDFDNDRAKDLCYRDETTLRVISPKRANNGNGSDYVMLSETTTTPGTSIMFSTPVYGGTGFEYPTIADVNMDGSANILVTQSATVQNVGASRGWINVYEYDGNKWAPSPPVWNQSLYNPLHINDDLTVPAKPISMLTEYTGYDGETIKPYNGAWIQQPIVKDGEKYVPVVRQPDAILANMTVEWMNATDIKVKVTIRNDGLASINANTPIYFYQTDPGSDTKLATYKPSSGVGVDIFADESIVREYVMPASAGRILHCRLVDDGVSFPAQGFIDCDETNNYGFIPIIKANLDNFIVYRTSLNELNVTLNDVTVGNVTLEIAKAPQYGTADVTIDKSKLTYTTTNEAQHSDALRYVLKCAYNSSFVATDTANVNLVITSSELPDNIITDAGDCVVPFEKIVFDVKQKWYSPAATAHCNSGPLVGDLDGDGIPEIITFSSSYTTLNVLDGRDGSVRTSLTIPSAYGYGGWLPVMTAVLVDSDRNGKGEIILATNDGKLTSYEAKVAGGNLTLEQKWQNTFVTPTNNGASVAHGSDNKPQPIVTDLNGDGVPEVVIFNQIYNAQTGLLLGTTETSVNTAYVGRIVARGGNNATNFLAIGDFDGDGLPEIAAGGKVYKVTISADGLSASSSILYQTTAFGDGFTAVADVNLDGKLDVVAVDMSGGLTRVNVWSPTTNTVIDQFTIPNSDVCQGYPFIGDIDGVEHDGKRYPEICVTTRRMSPTPLKGRVSAYKYNPLTKKYTHKWDLINEDTSGGTGITLFDFNNDGVNELVYRDEKKLYIYNGVADATPVLASNNSEINCTSGTAFEYPVIADVDGSGSAKICVTCANNGTATTYTLNVFESATTPWAPTRKVWNQVNYEPVSINEDLTVPKILFAKQTAFEVEGKMYHPYNGALIQVPIMDLKLEPVVKAADPYIVSIITSQLDATNARISVIIGNQGQMNVNASLPVSLYGGGTVANPTDLINTKIVGTTLVPGNTTTVTFDIPIASLPTAAIARLQDNGTSYPAAGSYTDCNMDNNTMLAQMLMGRDDHATPQKNTTIQIDVLANDMLGSCNASTITLEIGTAPANGNATIVNNKILYTPATDYAGNETFTYKISCGSVESSATVHVSVVKSLPDNIITDPDACIVEMPAITFGITEKWKVTGNNGESAHQKSSPMVGDLDGDGIPEIVVIGKTGDYSGFKNINVFDGASGELKTSLTFDVTSGDWASPVPFVLVDADANGWGEIVYVISNTIYSYEASHDINGDLQLTKKWGPVTYDKKSTSTAYLPQPLAADFNGDGKAEIVVNSCIINGTTGAIIGRTEANITSAYVARNGATGEATFAGLGDFDDDGLPELVLGASIYKITVNDAGTIATCSLLSKNTTVGDGFVAVADLDLDGALDVVVANVSGGSARFFTWKPDINGGAGTYLGPYSLLNGSGAASPTMSFPFVGDIDGKEENGKYYPEICFSTPNAVRAFRYNTAASNHVQKWLLPTSDGSGGTGIVLFDFDNDGASELVYRDETKLRIIDGRPDRNLTDSDNLASVDCKSGTAWEYPVIADVDGDGSANILVTCFIGSVNSAANTLMVYESSMQPWAPTRKVWHQVAYDAVQINENLTTPAYPLPKQTAFTANGRSYYPYNGTLTQVPIMNMNMKPVIEAADPYVQDITSEQINATTARVTVTITNQGANNVNSSIPIALYAESISTANLIAVKTLGVTLQPGNSAMVSFDVPVSSIKSPIIVRIQDRGDDVFPALGSFNDCNYDNNTSSYKTLMAVYDYASPEKNKPIVVDVLANDLLGDCDVLSIEIEIATNPTDGGAVLQSDKKIEYTPNNNFIGTDSFTYKIKCDVQESIATVTIVINSLLMVEKADNAQEPGNPGKFLIKFVDDSFSLTKDLEVSYTIAPINADTDDYTNAATGKAIIAAGQSSVEVAIIPNNNYKVEGNSRQVKLTINAATILNTP